MSVSLSVRDAFTLITLANINFSNTIISALDLQHIKGEMHTPSGFLPAAMFRLSSDKVVEHRKANEYSHNTVVWSAGNLSAGYPVAAGAIHYYARSPAGS